VGRCARGAGDLILQVAYSPMSYYYTGNAEILSVRDAGAAARASSAAGESVRVEGVTEPTRSRPGLVRRLVEPLPFALRLDRARRVWLVASEAPARDPAVDRALAGRFRRGEAREFHRVHVERYDAGS
jgi:hypothetical protein